MQICLPDVNVLVALHDRKHIGHDKAHTWFEQCKDLAWATCPMTENGFLRVFTQTQYPNNLTGVSDTLFLLENLIQTYSKTHHYWSDIVSMRDKTLFDPKIMRGHKQITDVYLLGLCQSNGATFVTLDTGITTAAIVSPHSELLQIL